MESNCTRFDETRISVRRPVRTLASRQRTKKIKGYRYCRTSTPMLRRGLEAAPVTYTWLVALLVALYESREIHGNIHGLGETPL